MAFTWKDTEPVRLYIYGTIAPVVGVLVAYGIVDSAKAALWIALGTAILGVGGTEIARSKVSPNG